MPQPRTHRRAAVLAAALGSWTKTTTDHTPAAARIEIRQAPDWEYIAKHTLSEGQVTRILGVLREDLIPPAPNTPMQAAAAVDQLLAEWRAEGRTRITTDDLIRAMPRIARSRTWLAEHLTALTDDGYLIETRRPGTYRI